MFFFMACWFCVAGSRLQNNVTNQKTGSMKLDHALLDLAFNSLDPPFCFEFSIQKPYTGLKISFSKFFKDLIQAQNLEHDAN